MDKFTIGEVKKCFEFAKEMQEKHSEDFQGYSGKRSPEEIFNNDLQGKLAEIAVKKEVLKYSDIKIDGEIDFETYERGLWDKYDLIVNNKILSVKSIKHYSAVLMIECSRFNEDGSYSYTNNDGSSIINDFYILTKMKIEPSICKEEFNKIVLEKDLEESFQKFRKAYSESNDVKRIIEYEVVRGISHSEFWAKKKFIPADTVLTKKNMEAYLLKDCELSSLPEKEGDGLKVDNWAVHIKNLQPFHTLPFLK